MDIHEVEFEELKNGLGFLSDDERIIDYMSLHESGIDIFKNFDKRDENTGLALFFANDDFKDLIILIRTKKFKDKEENGLIMFVLFDAFENKKGKKMLIEILNDSFTDLSFHKKVLSDIEEMITKSILKNA